MGRGMGRRREEGGNRECRKEGRKEREAKDLSVDADARCNAQRATRIKREKSKLPN